MTAINFNISGEYNLVVRKNDGTETETGWFPNLILNQGLNYLGIPDTAILVYASVGTGNSTPIVTQTDLDSPIAHSNNGVNAGTTNVGAPTYAGTHTISYTFNQGAVLGNITEVGVGSTNTAGSLFSRTLILDANGNPTSITLIAIDQLIVYYRLTITPPMTDTTGSVVLNGITYNYVSRLINAVNWCNVEYVYGYSNYFSTLTTCNAYGPDAVLSPIADYGLTGTLCGDLPSLTTTSAYTIGNYYRDWSVVYAPGVGNVDINNNPLGGIKGLVLRGGGPYQAMAFQIVFDNTIPKVNTNQLSLTFRFSWSR